jgi:hypothetical protein
MPEAGDFVESPPTVVPDLQFPEDVRSHHDRLNREAEGLFAGVNLLNVMEPLEDMDDSEDDFTANRIVGDFLRGLGPLPSEGIQCPWVFGHINCEGRFPCTSRDIEDHIPHCQLFQPLQGSEHFYEDLEALLQQPESKNLVADLQRQCSIMKEALCSLPDIDDFLCRLEALPNGNLKCQQPKCADWEEIKPDFDLIKLHFRLYHRSNFRGAFCSGTIQETNAKINSQMKRPKTASIMANILENLPTRSAIAQRILDFTNLPKHTSGIGNSSSKHQLQIQRPSWEQLRVLRTLRAKFVVHHRQFLQRTANSSSDRLQELRKSCRRHAELLDTGLLTFKAVTNNESPSSLKEIFAFISLSYAMAETMQVRGKPVEFCLDAVEMECWRICLDDWRDCEIFDELVSLLWPSPNKF